MATNENLIPIPGRLHSVATEGHVAGADEIFDDSLNKDQATINSELSQAVGTGGSVDSRIAEAVNVEKTRAEGAEEALDGRVDTLEEAVGSGGSVDERIEEAVAPKANSADVYAKTETYNKTELNNMITTPNQEYVPVTATAQTTAVTDVLPATGAADTTYRVGNWDGTQYNDSVFSEYAWNGSAYIKLSTKSQIGEVYDISANHADTKYADLAAALGTNGANIPQSLRKGGMSIKFVQSSDNKYVRYNLVLQTFTPDVTYWQKVTDNKYAVTNCQPINDCIKEFYYNNEEVDLSEYTVFRFYYGSSHLYGMHLFKPNMTESILLCGREIITTYSNLLTDNSTFWAIVDWEKIAVLCGTALYCQYTNVQYNKFISTLNYWPGIESEIISKDTDSDLTFDSKKFIYSGDLYYSLFGSISKSDYSYYKVKNSGSGDNIEFGVDANGKMTATVKETSDCTGFFFGFGRQYALDAGSYKLVALFKNEGYDTRNLTGLVRVYSGGTAIVNVSPSIKVDSNYITVEYEFSHNAAMNVEWFGLYQNGAGSKDADAKLTYLDCMIINTSILDYNSLGGVLYRRIKDISKLTIQEGEGYGIVIDVYPNNTPLQIANLIRSINDASKDNRYKIVIHNGEYQETDIITKDYVDIYGETYDKTVLIHNADATYNSPDNYSFGSQYSNIPVNTIPASEKHLIYHMANSSVNNITLKTVSTDGGQCKYICHQDGGPGGSSKFTAIFDHCLFLNGAGQNVLGVGAMGGQFFQYIGCQFIDIESHQEDSIDRSFNLHNKPNRSEPCGLRFENCSFLSCGRITISELSSGQSDYFEFINCICDYPDRVFVELLGDPSSDYSIILRVIGGNLGGIVPADNRQNTKLTIQAENIKSLYIAQEISFGTALYNGAPAVNANNGFVFKISDVAASAKIRTISDFSVGYGLSEAGNYAINDNVYINNGVFTKTANGNVAGKVVVANNLSEIGYVMIRKI